MTRLVHWLSAAVLATCVMFLLAPLVVTVLVSLSPSPSFDLPDGEWVLTWYRRVGRLDGLVDSLLLTAEIACVATAASLLLGTAAAIVLVRGQFPGRDALATFLVSPLMLPGLVVGIATFQFFRALGLREALPSLLLAHVVIVLPYIVRTLTAGLARFDFARHINECGSAWLARRDGDRASLAAMLSARSSIRRYDPRLLRSPLSASLSAIGNSKHVAHESKDVGVEAFDIRIVEGFRARPGRWSTGDKAW